MTPPIISTSKQTHGMVNFVDMLDADSLYNLKLAYKRVGRQDWEPNQTISIESPAEIIHIMESNSDVKGVSR